MADTEEYFPRGGKKPVVQHFKQSSNFLGVPEKTDKKKRKSKKKSEEDDGYLSDEVTKALEESMKNCAIGLSYKTAKPGMLILGRVQRVQETRVCVMLPNRLVGVVMACHISELYNKQLEAYVNDEIDHVRELSSIFRPGQYVAVKVLEADGSQLMLSMMPQHVNAGKMLDDIRGGCIIQAAVSSVEDHGYVMDLGIPNVRAFLSKKHANPEVELDAGVVTWVCVKSSDGGVVTLNGHLDALQKAVLRKSPATPLLPATHVQFTVDTPLVNGIEGHIFTDTAAYVQRQHVDNKDKKPALGQKVLARVLYVMPTRNTPFLTLRNIFHTTYPDLQAEQQFREGDIVEEAQVLRITGRSIHFKLGRDSVGTLSLKRIQVHEDLTDEEVVAKSYPIGSTHRVRILQYSLCDYIYSVSDQPSVLSERYFSLQQLAAGEVVTGTVVNVADNKMTVAVGRITGFVPHTHMSDAGIFIDPKKTSISKLPKKKFKVGQEVKARVLTVDASKESLILTVKPSLLAADLEVLSDYQQALIGKAYTGVIRHIRPEYVLVTFFAGVTAFVSRQYVTRDPDTNLTEAYHIGQIVNCTILKVDADNKKITGSLTTEPFWPAKKREFTEKRKRSQNEHEIPNKKQRADSESSQTGEKRNKDKKHKKQEEIEADKDSKKKNKKEKKTSISEAEAAEVDNENKPKKKNDKKSKHTEKESKSKKLKNLEQEDTKSSKKKHKLSLENNDDSKNEEKQAKKIKKGKHKKDKDADDDLDTNDEVENKKSKNNKKVETSEESDAIETDIYDSDHVLLPQDLALIDLSDCIDAKQYRRRIVSLLKAIKARTHRLDRIDEKIATFESMPQNRRKKKYLNAMKVDKKVVEHRIRKLLEVLKTAQDKYKELNVEPNKEFKKKKELKRERKESEREDDIKDVTEKKTESKKKIKEIKVIDNLVPALEVPSAKEFWSADADALMKNVQEEAESSSSDEEQVEQPKKKRKKLSVAEKVAKLREEEERVRELERRAIESESQPRSSEQFERALLANPDCSQLWIAYMAFHLQATEIEKARNVCRKALNTINFREEEEKLNVWLALLNCEHRFGTKESQQKTLEDALQSNDTFKVHSKLLDILVDTGKLQELSATVDLMLRKYKRDPQNYIICGAACFKLNLVDKARQVMQKAIAVLEKKEHVPVLVQFALMERSHGAAERAEALFEQILAVYPQRTDVCAVYADTLLKSGDRDRVRQVMERMTSQKLPARKMKVLYKKWIEIEEKIGDQEEVEKIRQRAMEFINKAKF